MKNPIRRARLLMAVGAVFCLPVAAAFGADTNSSPVEAATNQAAPPAPQPAAPAVAAAPAPAQAARVKLPFGVADVVKLTQAQVSEDVVLNFVLNSGTVYNLGPKDIIYLRDQGVSDRVITTMMNQVNRVAEESTQQAASQPQAPAPVYLDPNAAQPGQPLYVPAYPPPPAPEPSPSTVYVIPFTPPVAPYYGGYYPYYGGYYAPGVSFVYTIGRGGYHGRGYHRGAQGFRR